MKIQSVFDPAFARYGKVITGLDTTALIAALEKTEKPADAVIYLPSVASLEETDLYPILRDNVYGGMPIQIGFCNGKNHLLNALEYHRSSEINVAGTDAILLLGLQKDVTEDFTYDTSLVEAFLVPKGTAVELYATTLHYAPCSVDGAGFQVAVVLPKGTNFPLEQTHEGWEDQLITAKNKWLIGHAEGGLPEGAHIGLVGENISVN